MSENKKTTICDFCEHRLPEIEDYNFCAKEHLRHGSDGYGPWFSHAGCKHDPRHKELPDLFKPASESKIKNYVESCEKLHSQIASLKYDNQRLKERFMELANCEGAERVSLLR